MADNTVLNTGTGGDTIATDDIAGVKYQRTKPVFGADGSATDVSSANPLPVVQTGTHTVVANAGTGTFAVDTELPAAGALADATANPTTSVIAAFLACFNGATWDRARGDTTNGIDVDVTRVSGTVTIAGAVTNAGTFAVQDSEKVADNAGFTDGTTKVQPVGYIFDEVAGTALTENDAAAARIDSKRAQVGVIEDETTRGRRLTITAGNAAKVDGSAVTQPVSGNVGTLPLTTGGLTTSMTISAATTNATSVKGSAGQVYTIFASNINAAVRYLKLYNKATAPTVGTDTPVLVFAIPGNTAGAGFALDSSGGFAFATGIGFALTTGVANSDTGAVAANELVVNLGFK